MNSSKFELVELAKFGNQEAFTKLIEEEKYKLYKTGVSILKNDDDTCDAIQETLIKAYNNLHSLKNSEFFSSWLIRILINQCYDIIRKNKKVVALNEQIISNQDSYYEIYSHDSELESILNSIDSDLRIVTILYYYDEFSIREISDTLNIPEGTVKSRLSRARDKIYSILKEKEGEKLG